MKLAWMTDAHFNFVDSTRSVAKEIRDSAEPFDAVVITGDIAEGPSFVADLLDFQEVIATSLYFVLGNHDYWYSSFEDSHLCARLLSRQVPEITWLTESAPIALSSTVALVGHDGFYDAGHGNVGRSKIVLNDWFKIQDLAGPYKSGTLLGVLRETGRRCAREAEVSLRVALEAFPEIIFATHVPPWFEAAWHKGKRTEPDYLPWYTNRAMGEMLERVAAEYPHRKIHVLCGHVHSPGEVTILENLFCSTGKAEYGDPQIWKILNTDCLSLNS